MRTHKKLIDPFSDVMASVLTSSTVDLFLFFCFLPIHYHLTWMYKDLQHNYYVTIAYFLKLINKQNMT